MKIGAWARQGLPLYGASVRYRKTFDIPAAPGPKRPVHRPARGLARRRCRSLRRRQGRRDHRLRPFRARCHGLARPPGPNDVSVVVYGTLKNTLGPFHNSPPLGRAWPGSFQQGAKDGLPPGAEYSVVDYGLFEDFNVVRIVPR